MTIDIKKITTEIQKDLDLYINRVAKNMVQDFSNELTQECKSAIADFYEHYEPRYYERNWNFPHSFRRYYKNHGNHISGGVELLIDSMPNSYSDPIEEVFYRVYAGFHGYAGIFDNKKYTALYISGTVLRQYGKSAFSSNSPLQVQHLGFIPPRMVPSPMDRLYKKRDELITNKYKYQLDASKKALLMGGYKFLG